MHVVATMSEHPLASHGIGECLGDVLDRGGQRPDVLILTVTAAHRASLAHIAATTTKILDPGVLVGGVLPFVLGAGRCAAQGAAISALALWHHTPAGPSGRSPVELDWRARSAPGPTVVTSAGSGSTVEVDSLLHGQSGTLLLFTGGTPREDHGFSELLSIAPDLDVVGLTTSPVPGDGEGCLIVGGAVRHDGCVGVLFPASYPLRINRMRGLAAVGSTLRADLWDGCRLLRIEGMTALERVQEELARLEINERSAARGGLWLAPAAAVSGSLTGGGLAPPVRVLGTDAHGALVLDGDLGAVEFVRIEVGGTVGAAAELVQLATWAESCDGMIALAGPELTAALTAQDGASPRLSDSSSSLVILGSDRQPFDFSRNANHPGASVLLVFG